MNFKWFKTITNSLKHEYHPVTPQRLHCECNFTPPPNIVKDVYLPGQDAMRRYLAIRRVIGAIFITTQAEGGWVLEDLGTDKTRTLDPQKSREME